jgi:hypothetical protein
MIPFLIGLLMSLGASVLPPAAAGVVSTNWAGYVQEGSYTMAGAEWTVPTLDCAVTPEGVTADWVGVNGYGGNPGLFQAGTASTCATDGTQSTYAWWTDEDEHYAAQPLFVVTAGDVIFARVWEMPSGWWAYSVRDLSTDQSSSSIEVSSWMYGPAVTAEWIAEDPGNLSMNKPDRLADFGTVHFSHAQYIGTHTNATAIEMIIRSTGAPQAMPSVVAGGAWDVTYEG